MNAYEDSLSKESIKSFRDKVFKTKAGIKCLKICTAYDTCAKLIPE